MAGHEAPLAVDGVGPGERQWPRLTPQIPATTATRVHLLIIFLLDGQNHLASRKPDLQGAERAAYFGYSSPESQKNRRETWTQLDITPPYGPFQS